MAKRDRGKYGQPGSRRLDAALPQSAQSPYWWSRNEPARDPVQKLPYHGEPGEFVTLPHRGDDLAWRRLDPLALRRLAQATPPIAPRPPTAFLGPQPESPFSGETRAARELAARIALMRLFGDSH